MEIANPNPTISVVPGKSIFRNRNFMLLWITQTLTQTAQQTLNLALIDFVHKLSKGSSTQTAVVTIAFVLPGVIFSAIAGAFVDRVDKRSILIVTNVLRFVIIPSLILMDKIDLAVALPLIFLITCLFSTFSQFFAPAEGALIPSLVDEKQLQQANSLFQITVFGTQFIGFSILGPLLPNIIGSNNVFLLIAAIFALAVGLTWMLPRNLEVKREQDTTKNLVASMVQEIKEGWQYIRGNRRIWLAIIYLSLVQSVLFSLTTIGITYVSSRDRGLGMAEGDIIFILAPLSIGLGIGVWFVNNAINARNRDKVMLWSIVAIGVFLVLIGLLRPVMYLWVDIFAKGSNPQGLGLIITMILYSIPFGFVIALVNIPALTVLQELSSKDIVGRVFAAYFTFANLVSIFPILLAGALGDLIGLVPTLWAIGGAVIAVGAYGYFQNRKMLPVPVASDQA